MPLESQTAGFLDNSDPDTMLTVKQGVEPYGTNQNDEQGSTSAISQAVEPDTIEIEGEIKRDIPKPVYTSSYPGGKQALLEFLRQNVNYPEHAIKDSIEGRVVVGFVITTDGSITEPKVVRSVHPLLDAEALRVVNLMPKWEPGSLSQYNLPITFKLN